MGKEVEEEDSGKIDVRGSMSLISGLYVLDISPSLRSHFSLLVPISLRPHFLSCLSLIDRIRLAFCHFAYLALLNDVRVCCSFLLLELHWIVRVHFDTHSLLISHTPRLGETIIKYLFRIIEFDYTTSRTLPEMSSSTSSYDLTSNPPFTPKSRAPVRSSSTSSTTSSPSPSSHIFQSTPKPLVLMRSFSASSTSSISSTQSRTSQPSSPFLEPPSRYESRHPSELIYRRMPDSPKPHYFYERPGFFIPKRSAPKAPGEPRSKVVFIGGMDGNEEDDDE